MPQLFPANWIGLSVSLTLNIYLSLTFIYSLLFLKKEKHSKTKNFMKIENDK